MQENIHEGESKMKKMLNRLASFALAVLVAAGVLSAGIVPADAVPTENWIDYAADDFAGGSGTAGDPYQIATAEQLAKLAKDVKDGNRYEGAHFVLNDSIDLSGRNWTPIGCYIWSVDGSQSAQDYFSGSLDGNDMVITGLYVDNSANQCDAGLFGAIAGGGNSPVVKDLTIEGAQILVDAGNRNEAAAGILAGSMMENPDYAHASVENVHVSGTITVHNDVYSTRIGGLIGNALRLDVVGCSADVRISGGNQIGGLIGMACEADISSCSAKGSISGTYALGGLVGYATSSDYPLAFQTGCSMTDCTADVDITGSDWRIGGAVGFLECGTMDQCTSSGDIHSLAGDQFEPKAGGFAGEIQAPSTVDGSSSTGKVVLDSTLYDAGAFAGTCGGTLTGCTYNGQDNPGMPVIGGPKGSSTAVYPGLTELPHVARPDSSVHEYGDYYGNEKWDEVKQEISKLIEEGEEGETLEVSAAGLPYFPSSVARALKGNDITLEVRKNGVTYKINGLKIGDIDKIWYEFEDLETQLLTASAAESTEEVENTTDSVDKKNPETGR